MQALTRKLCQAAVLFFCWAATWTFIHASESTPPPFSPPLLSVSSGSRYFVDPAQKPVLLAGAHTWNSLHGNHELNPIYGTNPPALGPATLTASSALETWAVTHINPFSADDSGSPGAGSFSGTMRTADPQGENTADFLQEDGTTGMHSLARPFQLPAWGYQVSAWLKPAGRTAAELGLSGDCSAAAVQFNLEDGTVQQSYERGLWTVTGQSIEPADDGWFHCTATFNLAGEETTSVLVLLAANGTNVYTGDDAAGVFIWNFGIEPLENKVVFLDTDHVWGVGGDAT